MSVGVRQNCSCAVDNLFTIHLYSKLILRGFIDAFEFCHKVRFRICVIVILRYNIDRYLIVMIIVCDNNIFVLAVILDKVDKFYVILICAFVNKCEQSASDAVG